MLGYSHLVSSATTGCMCLKCIRERAENHKDAIAKAIVVIKDYQIYCYSDEVKELLKYLMNVVETL